MTAPLHFLSYADASGYLASALPAYGYGSTIPMPTLRPGPTDIQALKSSPQAIVFLTVGGGAGLTKDGSFDRPFITVRIVGPQRSFVAAEHLAFAVDRSFLSLDSSDYFGDVWALGVSRTGGGPTLLLRDDAERYHFTASYIAEAETGL